MLRASQSMEVLPTTRPAGWSTPTQLSVPRTPTPPATRLPPPFTASAALPGGASAVPLLSLPKRSVTPVKSHSSFAPVQESVHARRPLPPSRLVSAASSRLSSPDAPRSNASTSPTQISIDGSIQSGAITSHVEKLLPTGLASKVQPQPYFVREPTVQVVTHEAAMARPPAATVVTTAERLRMSSSSASLQSTVRTVPEQVSSQVIRMSSHPPSITEGGPSQYPYPFQFPSRPTTTAALPTSGRGRDKGLETGIELRLEAISAELRKFMSEQRQVNETTLGTTRQQEARIVLLESWKEQMGRTEASAGSSRIGADWENLSGSARAAAADAAGKELERRRRADPRSADSSLTAAAGMAESRVEARLRSLELEAKTARQLEERLLSLEGGVRPGIPSPRPPDSGRTHEVQINELLDFEEWLSRQVQAMQKRLDAMQDAVDVQLVAQLRRLEHQVSEHVSTVDRAVSDVRENCARTQEHEVKLSVLKTKTEAQEERLLMFDRFLRNSGTGRKLGGAGASGGTTDFSSPEGSAGRGAGGFSPLRLQVPLVDITGSV
mmetsp:Transcript_64909/g.120800  ORF Transcript_64909/g.120800 Transcript_64909/m.120800 type:complete len:552 (-) Transcript_64909:13-1668(-)